MLNRPSEGSSPNRSVHLNDESDTISSFLELGGLHGSVAVSPGRANTVDKNNMSCNQAFIDVDCENKGVIRYNQLLSFRHFYDLSVNMTAVLCQQRERITWAKNLQCYLSFIYANYENSIM